MNIYVYYILYLYSYLSLICLFADQLTYSFTFLLTYRNVGMVWGWIFIFGCVSWFSSICLLACPCSLRICCEGRIWAVLPRWVAVQTPAKSIIITEKFVTNPCAIWCNAANAAVHRSLGTGCRHVGMSNGLCSFAGPNVRNLLITDGTVCTSFIIATKKTYGSNPH